MSPDKSVRVRHVLFEMCHREIRKLLNPPSLRFGFYINLNSSFHRWDLEFRDLLLRENSKLNFAKQGNSLRGDAEDFAEKKAKGGREGSSRAEGISILISESVYF